MLPFPTALVTALLAAFAPASSQMPAVSAPTVGPAPASFDIQDLSLPAVAGQSFELRLNLGGHERVAPRLAQGDPELAEGSRLGGRAPRRPDWQCYFAPDP